MAKKENIDPQAWYTLAEITQGKMFPWVPDSYWSVRRIVLRDKKQKNVLKPVTQGEGTNTRYQFKGENIIKFIKAVETGAVRL